jgi:5-methyltetrahydrofolate--homocysteine methyltransferase
MNFNTLYPDFPFSLPMILDGATGTALIRAGMPSGVCPEQWILENPEVIKGIQARYFKAGSDAVLAPTFGANATVLSRYGLREKADEMNTALASLSRETADVFAGKYVAGDLSPTGKMLAPIGDITLDALAEIFSEQARALDSLVDFYVIETQMDLASARAAVLGVKAVSEKPVFVTMTVTESGKTMYGDTPACALLALSELGISAFGLNCSTGPREMKKLLAPLLPLSVSLGIPLIAKPNAGAPSCDGAHEHLTPEEFAEVGREMLEAGISVLGGCCGTDDLVIEALSRKAKEFSEAPAVPKVQTANLASTSREITEILTDDLPLPIEADDDLVDNAEEMADEYDFLYIAVRSDEDAEAVLEATPFLTLPIAVCGELEAISYLKRRYCGKIVTVSES